MKGDKDIKFEQPSDVLLLVNRYIMVIMAVIILGVLAVGYLVLLQPKIDAIKAVEQTTEEEGTRRLNNERLLRKIEELADEYEVIQDERRVDLDNLKKMLPDNPQIAEIFVMSERLAAERGFELLSININENIESESISEQTGVTRESAGEDGVSYEKSNEERALEELIAVYGDLKSLTVHLNLSLSPQFEKNEKAEFVELSPYEVFKGYLSDLENNLRLIDIKAVTFGPLVEPGNKPDDEQEDVSEETTLEESVDFSLDIITYYR